jgi:hypothetical protein
MRMDKLPQLTYGQVSSVELGEVADFVSKLANAGVLLPDTELETHLRALADLPDRDSLE